MSNLRVIVTLVCVALVACGTEDVGLSTWELPAGSDAAYVSDTIPTAMYPGERLDVSVTMTNTGTGGATNTWTASAPTYALIRQGANTFQFSQDIVESTTTTGSNTTFHFVLTAPSTPGTYSFSARMGIPGDGVFGALVTVPNIVVSTGTPRRWGCEFVSMGSSVPTTLATGETRNVTIVVQNTGTSSWSPSTFGLVSLDTPASRWGNTVRYLTSSVAPGGTATFTFPITAPATPGTYQFRRQMSQLSANGVGVFSNMPCLDAAIIVGGAAQYDSAIVLNTLPSTLAPSEVRNVSVQIQNTGATNWPSDGTIYLSSLNTPASLYGITVVYPPTMTVSGSTATFTFSITAPSAPGMYNQVWRMRNTAGVFGATLSVPLVVDAMAMPALNAVVVTQNIPPIATAGEAVTFTVEMQNTGTSAWTGSAFSLSSTNSPASLWGVTARSLGGAETIASGATRVFTFSVTAPVTPGTYASRWRMRQTPGAGFFGAEAVTSPVTVTLCGNAIINSGEQCDDDNVISGDGCSSTCQVETETVDLITATDRTLIGTTANRHFANVEIGDVTGDTIPEIVVGEAANVVPTSGPTRVFAGIVYGLAGGPGFFTNTSAPVSAATATFRILGASASDGLGVATGSQIVIADVTGDGINDLIVSAPYADGDGESRADAGEVYVLAGGAALSGDIDLGAMTPPTALTARIIGAGAGDRLSVTSAGDVTGDGIADVLVGAPYADTTNGTDTGAVYVIPGGAGLTGTIDLSTASIVTIIGPSANGRMGAVVAVGDILGSSAAELLIGNSTYTALGRSRSGAVWGIAAPVVSNVDLATAVGSPGGPSFAWFGATQNDNLGASIAIGHVCGSAASDVLLGATQQRRGAVQVGAVTVWNGTTITLGTTFDLLVNTPTATFLGVEQGDLTGSSLTLGDLNGDGVLDIPVVSAAADGPSNGRTNAGELAMYFGSAALTGTIDMSITPGRLQIYGADTTDYLGGVVGSLAIADIDGDGLADICVGSYLGGPGNEGRIDCVQSIF